MTENKSSNESDLLSHPVSSILHNFNFVDTDVVVGEIINKLDWWSFSSVVVVDKEKRIFGIITEQDIVRLEKEDINPHAIRAWELCSHKVITIKPDAPLSEAIALMTRNHIHHLVVSDNDKLVGLISSLDILNYLNDST